jgi:hypothetical protein
MKNILKIFVTLAAISVLSASCNKFLERNPGYLINADEAILTPDDVVTATMGVYTGMRSTGYYGKTFVVVNDMAADIATKRFALPNGHFDRIEDYGINESSTEIGDMWLAMYTTINRAGRVINAAKDMLNKSGLSEADKKKLNAAIAQCYGIKALTLFNLVNIYALPYNVAITASGVGELGVVNVGDKILESDDKVVRAKVKDNYTQILADLSTAKRYWSLAGDVNITGAAKDKWALMNQAALYIVSARVNMFMERWGDAIGAADSALTMIGDRAMVYNREIYKAMWTSNNTSSEDIFTMAMTETESTGATSIGNVYGPGPTETKGGGYGGRLSPAVYNVFQKVHDIRWSIAEADNTTSPGDLCYRIAKYNGERDGQVSNIPVVRLPELYLILAECHAMLGHNAEAVSNLFYVASRDTSIKNEAYFDSISTQPEVFVKYIQDERTRELMFEGHRWMDMRRWGLTLTKTDANSNTNFTKAFDVKKFAYPIPQSEINVTNLQQNEWNLNLPEKE